MLLANQPPGIRSNDDTEMCLSCGWRECRDRDSLNGRASVGELSLSSRCAALFHVALANRMLELASQPQQGGRVVDHLD